MCLLAKNRIQEQNYKKQDALVYKEQFSWIHFRQVQPLPADLNNTFLHF